MLTLDGETVVKAVPDIGYLHTGIEKTAEDKTYFKALVLTDRMDYLAPLNNNLGYSLAVEKLLGIERATRRRDSCASLLAELQRIASHLVWLGTTRSTWARECLPLLLPRARDDPRYLRGGVRRAHDDQLHHARWPAGRPAAGFRRQGARLPRASSRSACANITTCSPTTSSGSTARRASACLPAEDAIALGAAARRCAAAASPMTCARHSPTAATSSSTSIFPSAPMAMSTTAISYACWRWSESLKIIQQAMDGMPDGRMAGARPQDRRRRRSRRFLEVWRR